jgi:hypothetical protein
MTICTASRSPAHSSHWAGERHGMQEIGQSYVYVFWTAIDCIDRLQLRIFASAPSYTPGS